MKRAVIYTRVSRQRSFDADRQREELLAKFGGTHEIIGEYRDEASGSQGVGDRPALKRLLEDAAKGEFDVMLCTDLTRLSRQVTPEIVAVLRKAGVRIVTVDGGEIGITDLIAQAIMNQSAKTFVEGQSERIKAGKRAARERRAAADAAAGSSAE